MSLGFSDTIRPNMATTTKASLGPKYELTDETRQYHGRTLRRIRYLRDIEDTDGLLLQAGALEGWLENEANLSQEGSCAVLGDAMVMDMANVSDNAIVEGNAVLTDYTYVRDNAQVGGHAIVSGDTSILDHVKIKGHAIVIGGFFRGQFTIQGESIIS